MQSDEIERSVKNEIDALKKFKHENIIKMIDYKFATDGGRSVAYLLFPYTTGGSLRDVLNNMLKNPSQPWKLMNILSDFCDICRAINVLHTYSPAYVHRDIKPEVKKNCAINVGSK
jgi:serine/threonine protein kinase